MDFKSFHPGVKNADDIFDILWEVLDDQEELLRQTTPWDRSQWDEAELLTIEIDPGMIDRLYHICVCEDEDCHVYELVARMQYKNEPLFIELSAVCDFSGFLYGLVFVTKDANLFLNVITRAEKNLVYKSLKDDGFRVEDVDAEKLSGQNIPTLKYRCHEVIYKNEKKLRSQISQLPKILVDSVETFINVNVAKKGYGYPW